MSFPLKPGETKVLTVTVDPDIVSLTGATIVSDMTRMGQRVSLTPEVLDEVAGTVLLKIDQTDSLGLASGDWQLDVWVQDAAGEREGSDTATVSVGTAITDLSSLP